MRGALSERAARQAWDLFERYIGYRSALRELDEHDGSVAGMRQSLEERRALRDHDERCARADRCAVVDCGEGPDAPRVDLATLALATAAACDAKRSAAVDSDEEDWNRGGWEGLG